MNEIFKEKHKLTATDLVCLIQGKSLIFTRPDKYYFEILPPSHGVTVKYEDWIQITTFLRCAVYPDPNLIDELIKRIEDRK